MSNSYGFPICRLDFWRLSESNFQSVNSRVPKCQIDTLGCILEELTILKFIVEDNTIKQNELVKRTGKSLSTVKRIMESLQKKKFIRRINGKRYGRWEVLVEIESTEKEGAGL